MMIENHVKTLDERYPTKWDLYRSALGSWCVKMPDCVVQRGTIEEALAEAADYIPLPRIPRIPELLHLESFQAVKYGSKWVLNYGGAYYCGNISTKKAAMSIARHHVEMSERALLTWNYNFGHYLPESNEGKTFRWID